MTPEQKQELLKRLRERENPIETWKFVSSIVGAKEALRIIGKAREFLNKQNEKQTNN